MYLIKKTNGSKQPVLITDGLSQILEIETPELAEAIAEAFRKENPAATYEVVPVGELRRSA